MLAGSLASSPYMAYTATEYSVLGDSPSSRTSGWATFTCQQRDVLGYPSALGYLPALATEQDLTETQAKVPWVTLRGLLHFGTSPLGSVVYSSPLGLVVYSSQCSASLPKGHRARFGGYTSPPPTLVCRGVRLLHKNDAAVLVLGLDRRACERCDPTLLRHMENSRRRAASRPRAAGLLPPAANAAQPQLSSRSLLAAEMCPRDF